MKTITQKEFEENFDKYFDLVGEQKRTFIIILENGGVVKIEPVLENEWIYVLGKRKRAIKRVLKIR